MLFTSLTPPGSLTNDQDQMHLEWPTIPVYSALDLKVLPSMKPFNPMQTGTVGHPTWSQISRLSLVLVRRSLSLRSLLLFIIPICYPFFSFNLVTKSAWLGFLWFTLPTVVLASPWVTSLCLMFWMDIADSFLLMSTPILTLPALSLSAAQCCSGL